MELLRKNMMSEHQSVRWVVEVVNLDLEKLLAASSKKPGITGVIKKKDIKRSTRMRLQWRGGHKLKAWPTKDKNTSLMFDLRDGSISLEPPICEWVIDGVLKWKDGNVHDNLLLWIELIGSTDAKPHHQGEGRVSEKVIGKTYIDLSKYTPGRNSNGVSVIGETFDMTVNIRTMTPEDNPHQMQPHMANAATVGPALQQQEEPAEADTVAREQWLESNHQKLEGELRRTIMELNRNARAVLEENEKKKKQLMELKDSLHELQAKAVDHSASEAAARQREALEKKIAAQNELVDALQAELGDINTQEQKECGCVVS